MDQTADPQADAFYRRVLRILESTGADFLVGGAFAFGWYTGVQRDTKDFDVFVRREDVDAFLAALAGEGCRIERTFPHWLSKALLGDRFVDLIHGSGNGIAAVDGEWFEQAVDGQVLGIPMRLIPAEEMIWSKAFIMERERFDGADVNHLLRAMGRKLDWERLVRRFEGHGRILLAHLVLFGYVYPGERTVIPSWVLDHLLLGLAREQQEPGNDRLLCRGPNLSRLQYLTDLREWGYRDAREFAGGMTPGDIVRWTEAGEREALENGPA